MDILAPYRARIVISRLCRVLITLGLGLAWSMLWAQTRVDNNVATNGSVIGNSVLYSIGGGRPVSMSHARNMQSLGVGIGWDSNLVCGNISLNTTLENQLNGLTPGFQSIFINRNSDAPPAVA